MEKYVDLCKMCKRAAATATSVYITSWPIYKTAKESCQRVRRAPRLTCMAMFLVSGTQAATKTTAASATRPKSEKVAAVPMAVVSDKNVCATTRLDTQLAVAATPPAVPRKRSG